jgi:UMP-CMP kinase family protein
MTFSPPENEEIAARLTQRGDDTEEKVKVRLEAFHENINSIIDCYTDKLFKVVGNQDKNVVCKQITDYLDVQQKFQVVFVLGGPGSGKGTQCTRVKEEFGYVHLSAGDLLRAERNSGSETAEMINSYIVEGKIVPAKVTVELLKKAMEDSGKNKFLIDGFPRSKENLDVFYDVMGDAFVLNMCLVFDCPEEVLQERLLNRGKTSGRSDDNLESIKKRFKTFHSQSEPVINEFRRMGKVRIVDSSPPPDVVYKKVQRLFSGANLVNSPERTLAMVKPDAMKAGKAGEIIQKIEAAGFVVVASKEHSLTNAQAAEFYAEHEGKPFFNALVSFMTSGPVTALLLERPGAIKGWRALMGPTNTTKAREEAPDSLRALYGTDGTMNATHGSDSFISAAREGAFWFPGALIQERTLAMMKPIISELNYEAVMGAIAFNGFRVVSETKMTLSSEDVELFYNEHKGKSFFPSLAGYMQSGEVVALCLEKEGAIKSWRALLGPTNPEAAKLKDPRCLRSLFGLDGTRNGTHGSDSQESARKELGFWFNTGRVRVPRPPPANGASPLQMDALKYLKEFVDPIMAPLLQRILNVRPSDVNKFVVEDLGGIN